MKDALHELTWVSDIRGALGWQGLVEYLDLWDVLTDVILHGTDDTHHWKFEASGNFSSKSAYRAFFAGSVSFELYCPDTRIRLPVRDTGILRYAIFPKTKIRGYANIYKK